jgi:hypothetical protein
MSPNAIVVVACVWDPRPMRVLPAAVVDVASAASSHAVVPGPHRLAAAASERTSAPGRSPAVRHTSSSRATRWRGLGAGLLAAAAVLGGCAPGAAPQVVATGLHLPADGDTPCPTEPPPTADWTSEVQSFAATVKGPDMQPLQVEGSAPLILPDVPVGTARVVALFGLTQGAPTWRGVSAGLDVRGNEETRVDVLLARIADLSCTRSTSQSARAFHTATPLADGTILIVGGADEISDASGTCPGCRLAVATSKASTYDPRTGIFTPIEPDLTTPRMFHTAARLGDGRVVIAGGTSEALLRPVDGSVTFPLQPRQVVPGGSVEVYDPTTRRFSPVGDDPAGPRVFAAATTRASGEVIITGGVPDVDADQTLGNALSSTTVCGGDPLSCREGPPMARRRAGHSLFPFDRDGVYAWGGSVDINPVDGVDGFHLEFLADDASQFSLVEVASMQATRNVFFAGVSRYFSSRVLSVGGLLRSTSGAFSFALADAGSAECPDGCAAVFVFDRSSDASPFGGIATGRTDERPAMRLTSPRFLAGVAALPDERTAVIAGGFSDLVLTPANALERYDEDSLSVSLVPVGGVDRTLRSARGGATASAIGDGTVLFVGGIDADGSALPTAEVFADPKTPPQAAPLE